MIFTQAERFFIEKRLVHKRLVYKLTVSIFKTLFQLAHDRLCVNWSWMIVNVLLLVLLRCFKRCHYDDVLPQHKLNISVQFNTNIENLRTEPAPTLPDGHIYRMEDQRGQQYSCR